MVLPRVRGHKLAQPFSRTRYITPGESLRGVEDAGVLDTLVRSQTSFALRCSPVGIVYAKVLVIRSENRAGLDLQ